MPDRVKAYTPEEKEKKKKEKKSSRKKGYNVLCVL